MKQPWGKWHHSRKNAIFIGNETAICKRKIQFFVDVGKKTFTRQLISILYGKEALTMIEASYYDEKTSLSNMSEIVRQKDSIELTKDCKHCVILGNVEGVADECILKLAQWATSLWDYDRIKAWKKSNVLSPGYHIRVDEKKVHKIHVLDRSTMKYLFEGACKNSSFQLKDWEEKGLVAYVDWCMDNSC